MKLTLDSINNINVFENLTGAKVKDCIQDDGILIFLVFENDMNRAIGKKGSNVERVRKILKKNVRIIAYTDDVCKFVKNLIYPNKADEIKLEDKVVNIIVSDTIVKGRIYGRGKENMKKISSLVKNYFDIDEIKVV